MNLRPQNRASPEGCGPPGYSGPRYSTEKKDVVPFVLPIRSSAAPEVCEARSVTDSPASSAVPGGVCAVHDTEVGEAHRGWSRPPESERSQIQGRTKVSNKCPVAMPCSSSEVRTWPLTCALGGAEGIRTPDPWRGANRRNADDIASCERNQQPRTSCVVGAPERS